MKKLILTAAVLSMLYSANFAYSEAEDDIKSLTGERKDTLRFGIDSEVTAVINALKDEKDGSFTDPVSQLLETNLNPDILSASIDYFIAVDYGDAGDIIRSILENYQDETPAALQAALRYVSEFPGPDSAELILPLAQEDNVQLASAALSALGKCGDDSVADTLLDFLDDDDFNDDLKPSVIRALGQTGSSKAVDTLIDILEDVYEEKSWRWNACEALGLIGDSSALPAVRNALQDRDTYLRSYAVKALSGFDSSETEDILIQSLRDSFWRVRVSAAEALGSLKSLRAVDILVYKASKDPEPNVRKAAVKALGEVGSPEALGFLRDLYSKSTSPQDLRTISVEILIDKDLAASIPVINQVLAEEWEKDKSPVLGYTCKFLSTAKSPQLGDLFSKMMNYNDVAVKIYGIRGAGANRLGGLREQIESLSGEGNNPSIRKAALSALENL